MQLIPRENWWPPTKGNPSYYCNDCHRARRVEATFPDGRIEVFPAKLGGFDEKIFRRGGVITRRFIDRVPTGTFENPRKLNYPPSLRVQNKRSTPSTSPKRSRVGYFYAVQNSVFPYLWKCGRSNSPIDRIEGDAGTWWPLGEITVWCSDVVDDCVELESRVHDELAEYRVAPPKGRRKRRQEWFKADLGLIQWAVLRSYDE